MVPKQPQRQRFGCLQRAAKIFNLEVQRYAEHHQPQNGVEYLSAFAD